MFVVVIGVLNLLLSFAVQSKSGLLQASIVTAYCTYITWSAISTEPYGEGKSPLLCDKMNVNHCPHSSWEFFFA